MFEEGKNSDCLQHFYDGQSGPAQAVEPKAFWLIAVTDAASCPRSLVEQVERIAECAYKPQQLLLRAKELAPEDYAKLAWEVLPLCQKYGIELIIHTHWQIALELGIQRVHLPLPKLSQLPVAARRSLVISSSVHSVAEAQRALAEGAQALVAGHIYTTSCKAGLPPRGLEFLKQIHEVATKHVAPKIPTMAESYKPTQLQDDADVREHQSSTKQKSYKDCTSCTNIMSVNTNKNSKISKSCKSIPAYAIGGIGVDARPWQELVQSGAQGACIMSAYMKI